MAYLKRFAVESATRTYEETNSYEQAVRYCKMHGAEFPCYVLDTRDDEIVAHYGPRILGASPEFDKLADTAWLAREVLRQGPPMDPTR
jgi:hypothetical protein